MTASRPAPHGPAARSLTPLPALSRRAALAAVPGLVLGASAVAATAGPAAAAGEVVSVMYVEVNSNDLSVVGDYTLAATGSPVFDVAVIFAANINWDGSRAYLHLNERVQATLDDAANQIRPLQERGIKVTLSVLGNHQGAGFANFPDKAAAHAFAQELADVVEQYGLDGIDFDDEYANYGANGTGPVNAHSFVDLVTSTRQLLGPDKLITFYAIGEVATRTSYNGVNAGDSMDYAWNPWYGTWQVPSVPGMGPSQLSPAAVDIYQTGSGTIADFAQRTVAEGYGVFLTYNLGATDATAQISAFTRPLYGSAAVRS